MIDYIERIVVIPGIGKEIETADTIYLTREEVDMIKSFRNLSEEDKLLVRKLL